MSIFGNFKYPFIKKSKTILDGVIDGYEAFALAKINQSFKDNTPLLFIARDGSKLNDIEKTLNFIEPSLPVLKFPAWDCLPYDRISPSISILSQRLASLSALSQIEKNAHPVIILTSANAIIQKTLPKDVLTQQFFHLNLGDTLERDNLISYLERNGFERVTTVREKGEFAVRGGILDLFAPNNTEPMRLDFFGNQVETIRSFDAESQKTIEMKKSLALLPISEVSLTSETISQFRRSYIQFFGAAERNDTLYESISHGRRFAGMEHWLPLFYEKTETLFDYIPNASIVYDHLAKEAISERHKLIEDYYSARKEQEKDKHDNAPYHAIKPNTLYLEPEGFIHYEKQAFNSIEFTAFQEAETSHKHIVHTGIKKGKDFTIERQAENKNVFAAFVDHLGKLRAEGKKILITAWSEGSLQRLLQVLNEHGLKKIVKLDKLSLVKATARDKILAAIVPLKNGFEADDLTIFTEQDLLGERLIQTNRRRRKNANIISEANSLNTGDIVVHIDHGIGKFIGLKTIYAAGSPHDCLEIHYAGSDRLFLPVENIELLSRYSSGENAVVLDKIGGTAWQARKARLKKRLLELADHLIKIAAERQLKKAPVLLPPEGTYDEFVARFPYEETDDQLQAIECVLEDLAAGKPMDRLICGDVGFGKTEVALRAAFVAALNGYQTALVVPTTLLARQHYQTFLKRFQNLPVRIGQLSRLTTAKEKALTEKEIAEGKIDIIIGTHALLNPSLKIPHLGLLIIDEEQHFGVKHKERLKEIKTDIHVLTLSATPIPRTLQLALTGARELSLIASAPIDRLAVRTFVSPFDGLTIRETLLREYYRGGQSFYVCPRVSDIETVKNFLETNVPELTIGVAHGQMPAKQLDDVMNAFYDKQYDILLATTIVESGLDIPTANTMIIHRADMFGLAALYQIRGRIGRSKQRGYALLTVPNNKPLSKIAEKRLKFLQSLDTLGAGFQLASFDMDIRGAGNLLGEEQSGHIKEVGFALYQQMLEEAILEIKEDEPYNDGQWSPQINIGTAVIIPENYVSDLQLRLQLYRRLSELETPEAIDAFGAEMIDRFGDLPVEVEHLLKVVSIKILCKKANIEKLDAGEKGIVINFRNKEFSNGAGLIKMIANQGSIAKIRPDQSVVFIRDWKSPEKRLNGSLNIATQLAKLVS